MSNPAPSTSAASGKSRRIALVKPSAAVEDKVAHAMQLFDSILWALQGTTRSNWTSVPPDTAEVIVVHQNDKDARIAAWKASGKRVIEIATGEPSDDSTAPVLVYPFRATQAIALLERIDAELDSAGGALPAVLGAGAKPRDPWSFVDTFRTLREIQNSEAWLVARDGKHPFFSLRADGAIYQAEAAVVQAIRRGTLNLASLDLQKGAAPEIGAAPRAGIELGWFAGYYASDRIAPWLKSSGRFRVTRWPNFGVIRPMPSHIRVAAAMATGTATLPEIATRAQVSLEEATRTVNALAVANVVEAADTTDAPAAAAPKPRPAAPAPRGGFTSFLRNVRKHLGLGS